jgi:hypothetical protein
MGLKMPAPNLSPDFEEHAKAFADGLATEFSGQVRLVSGT